MYFVFLLELVLVIAVTISAWWTLGSGYGNFAHMMVFDPASVSQPPLTALSTFLFHIFYAWRIQKLSHSVFVPIAVAAVGGLSSITRSGIPNHIVDQISLLQLITVLV